MTKMVGGATVQEHEQDMWQLPRRRRLAMRLLRSAVASYSKLSGR